LNGQISKNGSTNFHFIFEELSDKKKLKNLNFEKKNLNFEKSPHLHIAVV